MEQRDYFMRQIDAMGKALASLLSKMLAIGSNDGGTPKMEMAKGILNEHLNLDIEELLKIEDDDLIDYLLNEIKLNASNFELMADILVELGKGADNSENYFRKSLVLLQYTTIHSENYNLGREEKIKMIKDQIE